MDINEKLDDILSNLKSLDFRLSNLETEFYEKLTLIKSLNSAFLRHESRQFKDLKEIKSSIEDYLCHKNIILHQLLSISADVSINSLRISKLSKNLTKN